MHDVARFSWYHLGPEPAHLSFFALLLFLIEVFFEFAFRIVLLHKSAMILAAIHSFICLYFVSLFCLTTMICEIYSAFHTFVVVSFGVIGVISYLSCGRQYAVHDILQRCIDWHCILHTFISGFPEKKNKHMESHCFLTCSWTKGTEAVEISARFGRFLCLVRPC